MKTNIGLIVGLVVSVLLATVFAVLWYGAYQDNKLLTRQVIYLSQQLQGNLSLLQKQHNNQPRHKNNYRTLKIN
jgi:hypothetical protein